MTGRLPDNFGAYWAASKNILLIPESLNDFRGIIPFFRTGSENETGTKRKEKRRRKRLGH